MQECPVNGKSQCSNGEIIDATITTRQTNRAFDMLSWKSVGALKTTLDFILMMIRIKLLEGRPFLMVWKGSWKLPKVSQESSHDQG